MTDYTTPSFDISLVPTQEDYRKLGDIEHLLIAPDMYIGSITQVPRSSYVMMDDLTVNKCIITTPEGLERLFIEILCNACDNVERSFRAGCNPGVIEITMDSRVISIKNGGVPIPIEKHAETGVWVPELVFTEMKAGSNFGKVRTGGGRNGIGSSAVNGFSIYFGYIIENHISHKKYTQYCDNRDPYRIKVNPQPPEIIHEYPCTQSSVTVMYQADLVKFGYENAEYSYESLCLFRLNAAGASLACKIPVYFNETLLDYTDVIKYASLYTPLNNYITHYQWPKEAKVVENSNGSQYCSNMKLPLVESIIIDTSENNICIGLCNSVLNNEGGVHVDTLVDDFSSSVVTLFKSTAGSSSKSNNINAAKNKRRDEMEARSKKKNKKSKYDVKQVKPEKERLVTKKDVKKNVSVIISVWLPNPIWKGQCKSKLVSFTNKDGTEGKFSVYIARDKLNNISNWNLIQHLEALERAKRSMILAKTDGKKVNRIETRKGKNAGWAGTSKSDQVTLVLFEGDSAMEYVKVLRALHPNGHNQIMLLPVGGKIKNANEVVDLEALANNKFFIEFKVMMGLQEGRNYNLHQDRESLRAGNIMIATDSDLDGIHIKCLIINFLQRFYPSLLEAGFIIDYRTKYLTVTKGSGNKAIKYSFYNTEEYEAWKVLNTDFAQWHHKYFKGLGTSNKKEIKEDWDNRRIVPLTKDIDTERFLNLAFNSNNSDLRKKWVCNYIVNKDNRIITPIFDGVNYSQSISTLIDEELVEYSAHTLTRHLPAWDGLADSNRKVIHGAIKEWKWWTKGEHDKDRLISFAMGVIKKTDYHHGDLSGVVIRMAQDFVGSNNISVFFPDGMYGSRDEGGKDAASPRYPYIYPRNWFAKLIFQQRDNDLLKYKPAEKKGKTIEPEIYYPPIPMMLVNGVNAIMTGFRSFIPCCELNSIIEWLIRRINGCDIKDLPKVQVWYNGFKGDIYIKDTRELKVDGFTIVETGEENDDGTKKHVEYPNTKLTGKYTMEVRGVVEDMKYDTGWITELPIGIWTANFIKNVLDKWKIEGKIHDYDDESTYEHVRIKVHFKLGRQVTYADFGVVKCYGLGNMYVLDDNGLPIKFDTLEETMEGFYRWRLPHYRRRKEKDEGILRDSMNELRDKYMYIEAVLQGRLEIKNRPEEDVVRDIEMLELNKEIYLKDRTNDRSYNTQKLQKLVSDYQATAEKLKLAEARTAEAIWIEDLIAIHQAYVSFRSRENQENQESRENYEM